MGTETKIEWCDRTFNPWIGCTKVSPGCDNCYAERSTPSRTLGVQWGPWAPRWRTSPDNWDLPRRWNAQHQAFFAQHGHRQRVFCASLADVFDNAVDSQWRASLFALIAATPNLDWLLLTKRIGNVASMLGDYKTVPLLPNIWLGATVVNQEEADRDIPKLLAVPARVRFLSMEPLLGPVDLGLCDCDNGSRPGPGGAGGVTCASCGGAGGRMVNWVIVGGESGPGARPMHPDWARSLRDQCLTAGVPFLFKQWGEWIEPDIWGADARLTVREGDAEFESAAAAMDGFLCADGRFAATLDDMAEGTRYLGMVRIGKKAAGRLLDGRTHDGVPS